MATAPSTPNNDDAGATAVITHRVRDDKHPEYERWLAEISPVCKAAPGHLDWHIIRPVPGLTATYTVVIRFGTRAHLQQWMESADRARLIAEVHPLLASGEDFFISSGLDFWFTPAQAKAKVPARWKQYLMTWSAIYPLVLGASFLAPYALQWLGIPHSLPMTTLAVTAVVVFMMVYVVMPRYTRLVQRWLFA